MSKYSYNITIGISRKNSFCQEIHNVPYHNMPRTKTGDWIRYYNQKIVIEAERNGLYTLEEIVENKQNSLYKQIEKVLLYLILKNKYYIPILRLSIKRLRGATITPYPIIYFDNHHPLLKTDIVISGTIPTRICDVVLQQTPLAERLRICVIHYLCGVDESNRYFKFERFWRAFEQASLWHSQHGVDRPNNFNAMLTMRQYIITPGNVPLAIRLARNLKNNDLNKCRWKDLIVNDFPHTHEGCANYERYFVLANTDKRLIKIIKTTKSLMYSSLTSAQKTSVDSHISSYTVTPERRDDQVLAVLLCRYAYFLRNITFHGEVADFSFTFSNHTKDDDALDMLNMLLCQLVFELFLHFDTL